MKEKKKLVVVTQEFDQEFITSILHFLLQFFGAVLSRLDLFGLTLKPWRRCVVWA